MSSQPIKVGFVGLSATGWASTSLAPALLDHTLKDTYKLVAVSTTSAESAAASAEKYGALAGNQIKPYHGSSGGIAEDLNVDLVAVSVKAPLHNEVVLPVIEKGKDFFLEWPAGKNLQETEAIREAAKRKGVKSLVGLQARGSSAVQKAKQIIDSGTIGKIISSTFVGVVPKEIQMWAPFQNDQAKYALDPANGATPLTIAAGHQLDAITYTVGSLTSVTASTSTVHPTTKVVTREGKETGETFKNLLDDHITFSGQVDNGAHATFVLRLGSTMHPGRKTMRWEIEGDKGSILMESDSLIGAYMNFTSPELYLNGEKVDVGVAQTGSFGDAVGILVNQWKEYAKGEKEGHYATIDDAVKNRRVLNAVEKSAREGKRIQVDLTL